MGEIWNGCASGWVYKSRKRILGGGCKTVLYACNGITIAVDITMIDLNHNMFELLLVFHLSIHPIYRSGELSQFMQDILQLDCRNVIHSLKLLLHLTRCFGEMLGGLLEIGTRLSHDRMKIEWSVKAPEW